MKNSIFTDQFHNFFSFLFFFLSDAPRSQNNKSAQAALEAAGLSFLADLAEEG